MPILLGSIMDHMEGEPRNRITIDERQSQRFYDVAFLVLVIGLLAITIAWASFPGAKYCHRVMQAEVEAEK